MLRHKDDMVFFSVVTISFTSDFRYKLWWSGHRLDPEDWCHHEHNKKALIQNCNATIAESLMACVCKHSL